MNRPRSTIGRIEKLEQAYGVGVAQKEPIVIEILYVEPGGEIVGSYVVEVGKPAHLQTASKTTGRA
jgi:hypothetical protein